jgi:S1-C subfamily serine protease
MTIFEEEESIVQLFEQVRHGAVFIRYFVHAINSLTQAILFVSASSFTFNPFPDVLRLPSRTGSGFLWDENHVVTNYHVVGDPKADVQVTFITNDSRISIRATVKGVDPQRDIAVLKLCNDAILSELNTLNVKPLRHGNSSALRVGRTALAIGNPFGLDQTLTRGIISGLGRRVSPGVGEKTLYNLIQTDASVNPGNSGGPLLDLNGNVIGMNTAIISTSGASAGIGFAIPIDTMKQVCRILIRDGKIERPNIGIDYMSSTQAKSLGVKNGLVVVGIEKNSPADFAGIRCTTFKNSFSSESFSLGDVITKVNGLPVNSEADLLQAIDLNYLGDIIELTLSRTVQNSKVRRAQEVTVRLQL